MYNLFLVKRNDIGFEWFFCLAQGGSFQKLVKDVLTKKECIAFLAAPDDYDTDQAFWFAKLHNSGISQKIIHGLIVRKEFFRVASIRAESVARYADVIQFYAKYHAEMDDMTFDEITDYIRANAHRGDFTLRGRTLNSVIALSTEWHRESMNAKYGAKVAWDGKRMKPWYKDEKEIIWEIVELKTNHDLITEGRKQHNCISSYVSSCINGYCNIFSLRRFHAHTLVEMVKNRITFEVRGNSIVQIRGNSNRNANDEEMRVLRKFALDSGFTVMKSRW
jgi:hypothetical protein